MIGPGVLRSTTRPTDVRVRQIEVEFRDVELAWPLHLAGAVVDRFTYVVIYATVADRRGCRAEGTGAGILIYPVGLASVNHVLVNS